MISLLKLRCPIVAHYLFLFGKGLDGILVEQNNCCSKCFITVGWSGRDPDVAEASAAKIYQLYEEYKNDNDFVGMDMARKFLQMGYTRAMRYANHKGGRKYDKTTHDLLPKEVDPVKLESAQVSIAQALRSFHKVVCHVLHSKLHEVSPLTIAMIWCRSSNQCGSRLKMSQSIKKPKGSICL